MRDREAYNAYMREYMKDRYYRRYDAAVTQLGGRCSVSGCKAPRSDLEIDHIDPKKKSFTLGSALAAWAEQRIQRELKKCQLLCTQHHIEKSIRDAGKKVARGTPRYAVGVPLLQV
jgi:hypothetical protein